MHFSNESETLLALVSVMLSADHVGTVPERKYLFDHVGNQKPFIYLDRGEFSNMVVRVNEQLFATEDAYNKLMNPAGIAEFSASVKACLSKERIKPAFRIACEIACADGLLPIEQDLLNAIGDHLGIPKEEIGQILRQTDRYYPVSVHF